MSDPIVAMGSSPSRLLELFAALCLVAASWAVAADAPAASAAVTTQTPVMGPSLLTAQQLAAWYARHGGNQAKIPVFHDNVAQLAQVFIDEGNVEGVRGDMAFVQSMVETGWLGFAGSQIPPDAYNYAGIYAFDGRPGLANCAQGDSAPSRCMGTPQHGVLMQMQLLRSYADPSAKTLSGRLISAPSDRAGMAPLWEYFGGDNCPCGKLIWASADNYGLTIIKLYSQALAESGLGGACVPYAPPVPGPASGAGYWEVTSDRVVHAIGTAKFYGDPRKATTTAPLVGGEPTAHAFGYWLARADGGVYHYGTAPFYGQASNLHLNMPINGIERSASGRGYWLVAYDGGVFGYGDAAFYGGMGGKHLNSPIMGLERTASGKGYWLFALDGGVFGFGDAQFYGSLGSTKISSPIVAMQRTVSGKGYWLLAQSGTIFAFGDAKLYGNVHACRNYGGGTRFLVTPDGKGYWVATHDGPVIAFGTAKKLGFPAAVGGPPIALMSAG